MRVFWPFALLPIWLVISVASDGELAKVRVVREWMTSSDFIGLAWSPDGQRIATHSNWGRTYTIWTVDGKRERDFEALPDLPLLGNSLTFLHGGQDLLTPHAHEGETAEKRIFSVWDVAQGRVIKNIAGPFPLKPVHFNEAFDFAVSRDESLVAVISSALPNQPVTLYSTGSWTVAGQFQSNARSLAFSPDSKRLAIGRSDGLVELYELGAGESRKQILPGYDPRMVVPIASLAFSPDGKYLAGGAGLTLDAYKSLPSVKIWRISDLSVVNSELPSLSPVRQIAWDRTGSYVAIAGGDHTVRLGSPIAHPKDGWRLLPFSNAVSSVAFSPKQDLLAVISGPKLEVLQMF